MVSTPPIPELPGITRANLAKLQLSTLQQAQGYRPDLGYSPRVFAQVSLPYRNPKNLDYWIRTNGDVTLRVDPHSVRQPDGTLEMLYPFGIIPRLLIVHLATEATRTGSRRIELGGSLTAFMRSLNMAHTGTNAERLRDQMDRFFRARLTFDGVEDTGGGTGETTVFFQFADAWRRWTTNDADGNEKRRPWENEVELSEQFYNQVIEFNVPLDLNALRALSPSPLRVDMYLWLAHRMFNLKGPQHISWTQLSGQFGSTYADIYDFKTAFCEALVDVRKVYPGLNIEEFEKTLLLRPSRTPIPRRDNNPKQMKSLLSGDRYPRAV